MNPAKDGFVGCYAAGSRKRRAAGWQFAVMAAAIALFSLIAEAPQACGAQQDQSTSEQFAPGVLANHTTDLSEFDPSAIEPPAPPAGEPLNDALCLGDDLEPVAPEEMRLTGVAPEEFHLARWDEPDVLADVRDTIARWEAFLANAGFGNPDSRYDRKNALEAESDTPPSGEPAKKEPPEDDEDDEAEADEAPEDREPPPRRSAPIPTAPPASAPRRSSASSTLTGNVIAGVSILSDSAERIVVGKNSSAAIDLALDCDRAEITDPTVADIAVVSPRRIVVAGKSYGMTQLILGIGPQQKVFNVSVELDLSLLANAIRSVSPTAHVHPRSVNGTILLTGTVPDAQTGERIAEMASLFQGGPVHNQLSVAGVQQTMLRVVVAEVNKEAVRQLGFNWAIGGADWSRDFFFTNNVGNLNPTVIGSNGLVDIGADPTPQLTYSIAPVANGATSNVTFGFPRAEFQVFMQALRQNSLARVLAEPNLVAISGQTATFLAGGEVPVPVSQGGATAGSITIEYKEFGIRLAFTPTALAGQIVRLHVMSEVSDAIPGDSIAGGLPVFSFVTRRVESTVECGNGQTFAMAGLLNETIQAVARKLPGLGDLPVIGALFSSVEYQKNNTELVVLVTPQLVEPLDPQQIPPPPGSLMTSPNDAELFAMGQLEGPPHAAPSFDRVPREIAPVNSPPVGTNGWVTTQVALRGPWGLAESDEN